MSGVKTIRICLSRILRGFQSKDIGLYEDGSLGDLVG